MIPSTLEPLHTYSVIATRWAGKTVSVTAQDGKYEGMIVDADAAGIFIEVVAAAGRSSEIFIPHRVIRNIILMQ